MEYYFSKSMNAPYDEVYKLVTESLAKEGFGVVSEIKMHEKFKEKLGVDFRKYVILGACNSGYAFKALQFEDKIGTMLPCNIVLQELSLNVIEVAAVNPIASMIAIQNAELKDLAEEITAKLQRVIVSL